MKNEKIEETALNLVKLTDEVKFLENKLKEKKEIVNKIRTEVLPDMLSDQGYTLGTKLVLSNGRTIVLKDFFTASIPSKSTISKEKNEEKIEELIEKRDFCFKWLEENGLEDIIKKEVSIRFNKEENEQVKKLICFLINENMLFEKEQSVHPSTLKASLKELMESGKNIPFDSFNAISGTIVEVK